MWHSTKYLFPLIKKVTAMIHILLSLINLQRWYKSVKIIIVTPGVVKVILDIIVCYYYLSSLVITNSCAFYPFETCYYYAIFQILDAAILLHFICKSAALLKGQIVTNRVYFLAFN